MHPDGVGAEGSPSSRVERARVEEGATSPENPIPGSSLRPTAAPGASPSMACSPACAPAPGPPALAHGPYKGLAVAVTAGEANSWE